MAMMPAGTVTPWGRWLAAVFQGQQPDAARPVGKDGAGAALDAFEAFFRRYEPGLTGYLWRMIGDAEAARDLCQEAFVRAWAHFDRLQSYTHPAQWLYRVATNLAVSLKRRPAPVPLGDEGPAASDPSTRFIERDFVRQILAELPPKTRALLILRDVEQWSYADLADLLEMSPDAVKMALSRARAQFRERYARKDAR